MRFHKFFFRMDNVQKQAIAYKQHLLRQKATLRKIQLMRYFALDFFHDGRVHCLRYSPTHRSLEMVLESAPAKNAVCDALARNPGKFERLHDDDFLFRVVFSDAQIISVTGRPGRNLPDLLGNFDSAELTDWHGPFFPPGYTLVELKFQFWCTIRVVVRAAHVTWVPRRRGKGHLSSPRMFKTAFLVGRNAARDLRGLIRGGRRALRELREHGEAPLPVGSHDERA